MATQSLYRRYRPRRFSEVKGQEHVVLALRNAVINGREGQAYLFSGPRGTGKTTSARILAKVLNCDRPAEGEPCCECASCLAVEAGTSYDVHELDAASNNGVEAMRDLIEKTMLGTPGRHKVYILDEVHMLSKGAEAALLKTLEEPPPHVVFVLATTDPQRVSETIRSRTQQLQFRLLPMDVLDEHVRWLARDAGLNVDEAAIAAALRRGGGSARDTLSALEVIASGGAAPDDTPLDEFVEALIEQDPGRALAAVAAAIGQGRESRALTEALLAHLRDCFLCLMAPELVQLPAQRAEQVGELAERLAAPATVRALETLGAVLLEMRHAPDPRILLEVALVKLANPHADTGNASLVARLEKLEHLVARGVPAASAVAPVHPAPPAPRDPTTGRAVLGGRIRREAEATTAPDAATTPTPTTAPEATTAPEPTTTPHEAGSRPRDVPASADPPTAPPSPTPVTSGPAARPRTERAASDLTPALLEAAHVAVAAAVRPLAKAALGAGAFTGATDDQIVFALPSDALRRRAEDQRTEIEGALSEHFGRPITLDIVVDGAGAPSDAAPRRAQPVPDHRATSGSADDDVDLSDLVDAPKDAGLSGIERITAAFPGAELLEEES